MRKIIDLFTVGKDDVDADARELLLLVEDDEDLLLAMESVLGEEYEVITAVNGREGYEQAVEHAPDLVVTDIIMPEMDGIALCQALKEHVATSHIPIIMLTSRSTVENQIDGLESGADDYVTKPFVMQLLKARINNLIDTRKMLYRRFRDLLADSEKKDLDSPDVLDIPPVHNRGDREFIEKTYTVLQRHYAEDDFSVDVLIEELCMSRRSAFRKIKVIFDRTPLQLITEYRLKQACKMLHNQSMNTVAVAMECGFGDVSNFYRTFKRAVGKSPSQYREEEL